MIAPARIILFQPEIAITAPAKHHTHAALGVGAGNCAMSSQVLHLPTRIDLRDPRPRRRLVPQFGTRIHGPGRTTFRAAAGGAEKSNIHLSHLHETARRLALEIGTSSRLGIPLTLGRVASGASSSVLSIPTAIQSGLRTATAQAARVARAAPQPSHRQGRPASAPWHASGALAPGTMSRSRATYPRARPPASSQARQIRTSLPVIPRLSLSHRPSPPKPGPRAAAISRLQSGKCGLCPRHRALNTCGQGANRRASPAHRGGGP